MWSKTMADSGNNDGKICSCTGDTMTDSIPKDIGFIQVNSCLACMWPQTAIDETIQYHYCGRMGSMRIGSFRLCLLWQSDKIYCPLPKEMVYISREEAIVP